VPFALRQVQPWPPAVKRGGHAVGRGEALPQVARHGACVLDLDRPKPSACRQFSPFKAAAGRRGMMSVMSSRADAASLGGLADRAVLGRR